jgi:hypothetical protein
VQPVRERPTRLQIVADDLHAAAVLGLGPFPHRPDVRQQRLPASLVAEEDLEEGLELQRRPGATWEADEHIRGAGRFAAVSTCITCDPPRELAWKPQAPPIKKGREDSRPDITWWVRLSPSDGGTFVEQEFRVVEPRAGGGVMKVFYLLTRRETAIRRGMRKTIENVKAAAEGI